MIYLDTSYIVKAYVNEPGSDEVLKELANKTGLVSSILGRIEFTSALMRQRRAKELSKSESEQAQFSLESDTQNNIWTWTPISREITQQATKLLIHPKTYGILRTLDAIHLASAMSIDAKLIYTHDKRMLEAAQHFGLKARDVIPN
jgi:predicted nucleic acid-binding protein